ncbi:MAG: acyltransferase [Holophagales bacterium]|nr:MAG: acyltransferase [Holophagales bacterium]
MGRDDPGRRRDIDGMRALAITLVIAYHLAPRGLRGGFIGVDVFFVLSGYLITQILVADGEPGRFRRFYELRIRRLAPALVVVLATTLLAGRWLLLAGELRELASHTLAATLFVANIAFWFGSGYFDSRAIEKPLLHLWSLGIEEQFYLLWPVLLWWLVRRPRRVLPTTLCLALASFAATVAVSASSPDAAFYLPWFRFWELLAGACLAHLQPTAPVTRAAWRTELAAWVGGGLILGGAVAIDPAAPFPSWSALAPVVGTALLLRAAPGTWLGRRVLSHPLAVGLGMVSYPLYLWHWPLLSFQEVATPQASLALRSAAMILALILATATYRWVEMPVRTLYSRWPRPTVLALSAALLAVAGSAAILRSVPLRPLVEPSPMAELLQQELFRDGELRAQIAAFPCPWPEPLPASGRRYCSSSGGTGSATRIVMWGDSTAESWGPLAHAVARRRGGEAEVLSISGCPPLLAVRTPLHPGCELDDSTWKLAFLESARPTLIVLTARWGAYVNEPVPGERGPGHLVTTSPRDLPSLASSREAMTSRLPETIARLARIAPVVVIASVPDLARSPVGALQRGLEFRVSRADHEARQRSVVAQLTEIAAHEPRVKVLDPAVRLCASGSCEAVIDGTLFYTDETHVSAQGALAFEAELTALLPPPAP